MGVIVFMVVQMVVILVLELVSAAAAVLARSGDFCGGVSAAASFLASSTCLRRPCRYLLTAATIQVACWQTQQYLLAVATVHVACRRPHCSLPAVLARGGHVGICSRPRPYM